MWKNIRIGKYTPSVHQLGVLITLPIVIDYFGVLSLPLVLSLALLYQLVSISFTGHILLGHNSTFYAPLDKLLHYLFFYTTFVSPAMWGAIHMQHHKQTDTEKDPQAAKHYGMRVLLLALWNLELIDRKHFITLYKKPWLKVIHDNHLLMLLPPLLLALVVPWQYLLLFWLVPASLCTTIATYSAWYSHRQGEPLKKFDIFHTILIAGEHRYHQEHHDKWTKSSFDKIIK